MAQLSTFLQTYIAERDRREREMANASRQSLAQDSLNFQKQQAQVGQQNIEAERQRAEELFHYRKGRDQQADQLNALNLIASGAASPSTISFEVPGVGLQAPGPVAQVPGDSSSTLSPLAPLALSPGVLDNPVTAQGNIPGGISLGGLGLLPNTPERQATTQLDFQIQKQEELRRRQVAMWNQEAKELHPNDPVMQNIYVAAGGKVDRFQSDPEAAATALIMRQTDADGRPLGHVEKLNQLKRVLQMKQNPYTQMLSAARLGEMGDTNNAQAIVGKIATEVANDPLFKGANPQQTHDEIQRRIVASQIPEQSKARAIQFMDGVRPPNPQEVDPMKALMGAAAEDVVEEMRAKRKLRQQQTSTQNPPLASK